MNSVLGTAPPPRPAARAVPLSAVFVFSSHSGGGGLVAADSVPFQGWPRTSAAIALAFSMAFALAELRPNLVAAMAAVPGSPPMAEF